MTSPPIDVIVVGAGIVGASCAWACTRAGLRVAVLEAGGLAEGTTATNMGQVLVEDSSPAEFELTRYSARLWAELAPELPADAECRRIGTVWIATSETELRLLEQRHRFYRAHDVRSELWDSERLRREEPELRAGLAGGLLMPDDLVVTASPVARLLLARVRAGGGTVEDHTPVRALGPGRVVLADGRHLSADRIVNAAGVGAPQLSPGVPVRPRKGHLAYTDARPGLVHHQLIEVAYVGRVLDLRADSISFNVQPRPAGELRIGSSRQLDHWESAVEPGVVEGMFTRATEFLPGLAGAPIGRVETGLRPASSDGLPLIGPWPPQEGVWLATGHEGLGITMSLGTGRLVADQLTGRQSDIPIEPYLPRRVSHPTGAVSQT